MHIKRHHKLSLPLGILTLLSVCNEALAVPLKLHHSPLYLSNSTKPNVLVILDNSNSMDESPTGTAVGSSSPDSKSEIARNVVKNIVSRYTGKVNLGLMAYQQQNVVKYNIHNSIYDASYSPLNYKPAHQGNRASVAKRFRTPNPTKRGAFIYYNIALPFYSYRNEGNAFCRSSTADFDNGRETKGRGPWDRYYCFRYKTNTSDSYYSGYSGYRGGGTFTPTDSDYAQNILDFGRFMAWSYVSPTWFSNQSPGKGYLHVDINELNATHANAINTKLATSQFTYNRPRTPGYPLQNAGLTPLEGTLLTANNYFKGSLNDPAQGGSGSAPPEACSNNSIALLTDGLPSTSQHGSETTNPDTAIAAVAAAASKLNSESDVDTYVIGFALPQGIAPDALDSIAQPGNTGSAYSASAPAALQDVFDNIFDDIFRKLGSSSSVATNSSFMQSNSTLYQARYNSKDWSGELTAKRLTSSGLSTTILWNADDQLKLRTANRTILTYGLSSRRGIPFRWQKLKEEAGASQASSLNSDDLLGRERLEFIRGKASHARFRTRESILGDIINSSPLYVGPPRGGYTSSERSGYSRFIDDQKGRPPMVFVGANDGMLHGFNANSGDEILAYVPSSVYPNLAKLSEPDYGSKLPHQYYTDGSPMFADVQLGANWKTVLVSGLNAGGQGYFALDVTNPSLFSEANPGRTVLWEFTDQDDPDLGYTFNQPRINSLTGQSTQIVKLNNQQWAVVFGNGYNNTQNDGSASNTGHAYLYILFIDKGLDGEWSEGDFIKIDTNAGSVESPNGLATPTAVDDDLNGTTDYVYAGDLLGNMYKFDLSSSDPRDWSIAHQDNTKHPIPFFKAISNSGTAQPITSAPVVNPHPRGGHLISFGTGIYLQQEDITDTNSQSFYAIRDTQNSIVSRSELSDQSTAQTIVRNNTQYRLPSQNLVDYSCETASNSCHMGWFMNLPNAGERVVYNPVFYEDKIIFVTAIPNSAECSAGGSSWLIALNYLTGKPPYRLFDTNGDRQIDSADELDLSDNSESPDKRVAIGVENKYGILTTPTIVEDGEISHVIAGSSEGSEHTSIIARKGEGDCKSDCEDQTSSGRTSWQQRQR